MSDATATIVGAVLRNQHYYHIHRVGSWCRGRRKDRTNSSQVGVLMLSGLFFTDLFAAIPQFAMACALVIIGALMMRQAADIDWSDSEMAVPAFLTIVLMPFTYSIADGIAFGIISYCAIKDRNAEVQGSSEPCHVDPFRTHDDVLHRSWRLQHVRLDIQRTTLI